MTVPQYPTPQGLCDDCHTRAAIRRLPESEREVCETCAEQDAAQARAFYDGD